MRLVDVKLGARLWPQMTQAARRDGLPILIAQTTDPITPFTFDSGLVGPHNFVKDLLGGMPNHTPFDAHWIFSHARRHFILAKFRL